MYERPINGKYILDLSIPPSLVLPFHIHVPYKNLNLHTTSGSITAEVWIRYDGGASMNSKRVSFQLGNNNGSLCAVVHKPSPKGRNSHARPTLDMELRAFFGDVSLSLPRSFRGPIAIHTGDDRIAFSPAFAERVTLLSRVSLTGVRTYFVGDRPEGGKWGYGDTSNKADDNLLDNVIVYGKYTCTLINFHDEGKMPTIGLNVWQSFCSSVECYFSRLKGPVLY